MGNASLMMEPLDGPPVITPRYARALCVRRQPRGTPRACAGERRHDRAGHRASGLHVVRGARPRGRSVPFCAGSPDAATVSRRGKTRRGEPTSRRDEVRVGDDGARERNRPRTPSSRGLALVGERDERRARGDGTRAPASTPAATPPRSGSSDATPTSTSALLTSRSRSWHGSSGRAASSPSTGATSVQ